MKKAIHKLRQEDLQSVIDYYDQTRFDYNVAWLNEENLAVHFGFYDQNADKHAQALLNTNKILAEKVRVKAGEQVLDAGCGKGGSCFWLAREKKAVVTGITPVPSQIEDCQQQAQLKGLTKSTTFLLADYCHTPFEDASFDVIWACESVCHTPDKGLFYQEAYRLLRPGGRLIIAEYIRRSRPLPSKAEQLLYAWLSRWAIPDIDTSEEHQIHAQKAGFRHFQLEDYTSYTWISLKNLHKISRRWIGIGHFLRMIGVRSKIQHGNHVGSIRQFQALQQGYWFYGLIYAEKN